jgi:hypothetical protein
MGYLFLRAIILLAVPVLVFAGGAYLIGKLSDRQTVTNQLKTAPIEDKDKNPLGLRFCGYNSAAVGRHWGALDPNALGLERRSLELDLMFPFFYGAALAGALLCAWATLSRPLPPAWLLLPVAITVVADWIENLVQLGQLRLFNASHEAGLQSGWIRIASAATVTKWLFSAVASLLLIYLTVRMIVRAFRT